MAFRPASLLPGFIKRPLRQLIDRIDNAVRGQQLRTGLEELRRQTRAGSIDPALLSRLRRAWGNESFSADDAFIAATALLVLREPGPFLDLGSGISTLVAGVMATELGREVWSVEQDGEWHRHVAAELARHQVGSVRLYFAPLQQQQDYAWYELSSLELPPRFAAVFCDGPSVRKRDWPEPVFRNWRAGVVPLLRQRGVSFGEILLDDAQDSRCEGLCRHWRSLGLTTEIVATGTGSYVVARPG